MSVVDIRSDITGNIWKVLKSVGDTVAEEEVILIMESMKMEIPVMASDAGTLVELCVSEGDTVENEEVVARIQV